VKRQNPGQEKNAAPVTARFRLTGPAGRVIVEWMGHDRGESSYQSANSLPGGTMLSQLPLNLGKVKKEDLDREILRAGIIAELDAINFYEQMAALTENENIRKVLLDIAKEEKTHMGEFQTLLLMKDEEQKKELKEGEEEIKELLEK
jgi:hypothetical protein